MVFLFRHEHIIIYVQKDWFVTASPTKKTCWEWTRSVKIWYAASDHLYACITNEISSCKIKINNVEFIWNSTSDTEKKCKYLNWEIQNNVKMLKWWSKNWMNLFKCK